MRLPRLYAILDRKPGMEFAGVAAFAAELLAGGVTLLQYRNKQGSAAQALAEGRELKRMAAAHVNKDEIWLIMNDRADIAVAGGLDGVHLGQDDISPAGARLMCASPRMVGISTHNLAQLEAADAAPVDYIAFGPIFATASKSDPEPVVGLEGLRRARSATRKPLVAIGGITAANCRQVIDAGADAVAVISALAAQPRQMAEEFLRRMS